MTYMLAAVSFLAVAASGYMSLIVVGLVALGMVVSWFWDLTDVPQSSWIWNALVLVVLGIFVGNGVISGDWLLSAVNFTSFVLVGKLFNRRSSRDVFHCYLLSFLLFIASGVINPGISYAVIFPFYIVILTLALLLLHLKRDMGELYEKNRQIHGAEISLQREEALLHSGRIFRPSFLFGTAALAVVVFLSSLTIFYLFPRLGFGFFLGKKRPGLSVAGFSDKIRLGSFGRIRSNHQVVLRVELPDQKGTRRLRLRGMSFDVYTGRGWVKSDNRKWQPRSYRRKGESVYFTSRTKTTDLRLKIYQEPLSTKVIFGEPRIAQVRVRDLREGMSDPNAPKVFWDRSRDLFYKSPESVAISYTVLSNTFRPSEEQLRKARGELPIYLRNRYTRLPRLDPRIRTLMEEYVAGKETTYDRVKAIGRRLSAGFRYSLKGQHDYRQPLVDFLFNKKYGHCEFFSTTMAVMVRMLGVPARVVTGFYGGVWNKFGKYVAIRQNDAHAWVEVYFPKWGWVTFDPTPGSELLVPRQDGTLGWLKSWVDAMQLRWFKWVIEYDLQKQIRMFQSVVSWMQETLRGRKSKKRLTWFRLRAWLKRIFSLKNVMLVLLCFVAIIGMVMVARRYIGRRRKSGGRRLPPTVPQRYYRRMLSLLARIGFSKPASQTPLEFVAQLKKQRFDGTLLVQRITHAYQAASFGDLPIEEQQLNSWLKELKRVTAAAKP